MPWALLAAASLALAPSAWAGREATQESLDRLQETFATRAEEAGVHVKDLLPAIVVSVAPAYEQTRAWYPTAALNAISRVLGAAAVRWCAACEAPRTDVAKGRLEQSSGPVALAEIARLDEGMRGSSPPARSAIWLDETPQGVSLRVVDLRTGRIAMAELLDPRLSRRARTEVNFNLSRELDRRARGDSLTQLFVDLVLFPGQHISLDWTEQWGDTNANLSGLTLSLVDPFLGVGGVYYRAIPEAFNLLVGAQLSVSIPIALVQAFSKSDQTLLGDNLVTLTGMVRIPIGRSNYGIVASLSTNGRFGVGISLMNVSILPVLP